MPLDGNSEYVTTSPALQVLVGARDLLVREGWIQNAMHSKHGHCISGAIEGAAERLGLVHRHLAESEARQVLRQLITPPTHRIWKWLGFQYVWLSAWNDAKGRTKEEAITLFDRAIAVARERNK